jgi:hypothetical protein
MTTARDIAFLEAKRREINFPQLNTNLQAIQMEISELDAANFKNIVFKFVKFYVIVVQSHIMELAFLSLSHFQIQQK